MMAQIMTVLSHWSDLLVAHADIAATVLGVLFAVSKAVSTSKAPVIVSAIQGFFDSLAQVLTKAGSVASTIANALAKVLQSDGVLGSK